MAPGRFDAQRARLDLREDAWWRQGVLARGARARLVRRRRVVPGRLDARRARLDLCEDAWWRQGALMRDARV